MSTSTAVIAAPKTIDDVCALFMVPRTTDELEDNVLPLLRKLAKPVSGKGTHIFSSNLQTGNDPLAAVDPSLYSAGYLFLLNYRLSAPKIDVVEADLLFNYIVKFVQVFNPHQLRLIPDQVMFLARSIRTLAGSQPELTLAPLYNLITRYCPTGLFSSMHPILLAMSLASRNYQYARSLLVYDIIDIDTNICPFRYQDNLLYNYYGGVIMALTGDNARAIDFLESAVSAPGPNVSAIQLDAYRKLVLLQLIVDGKTSLLPKYTSSQFNSAYKVACVPYIEYAAAYESRDKVKLESVHKTHQELFVTENNAGLINRTLRAFRRKTVQKLTDTFITVTLPEIAQAIDCDPKTVEGLRDAHWEISDMLASREIYGSISPLLSPTSYHLVTITFIDDPEPFTSHATVQKVEYAIQAAKFFESRYAAGGERLGSSKDFVQKAYNAAGSSSFNGGNAGGGGGGLDGYDNENLGGDFMGGFEADFDD